MKTELDIYSMIKNYGAYSILIFIIFYLVFYPEKAEKLSVLLYKIIYTIFKLGEKQIVTHDIQARVNEFSKTLSKEIANLEPVGIKLQWISDTQTPEQFFDRNKLVIRMRRHDSQDKNFINASMVFVSSVFLKKSKKYMSKSQKESIDLYVGKKLFEMEKPQIADQFYEDFFSMKTISNEKIMGLIEKYEIIDKVGLFFPILVQELTFFGEKIFYKLKTIDIIKEISAFIDFLKNYAEREIGEERLPKNFTGVYCRCGIVIIGEKLKIGLCEPYVNYIKNVINDKIENIYLIGPATKENINFIKNIIEEVQSKLDVYRYVDKKFKSKIKIKEEIKEVNTYLVVLRSKEVKRYIDEEYSRKYIDKTNK
jgi:hypothetical protein